MTFPHSSWENPSQSGVLRRLAVRGAARGRALALGVGLAVATTGATLPLSANAAPLPDSFAPLVEKVLPAVVTIATTQVQGGNNNTEGRRGIPQAPQFPPGSPFEQFFREFGMPQMQQQRPQKLTALGSGFIIDPSGVIVTNNHVVENGTDIKVTLQDGTVLPAKLVGHDERTDLALVKIEAGHPLASVQFGDSDQMRVGDWIVAAGNPFGLGGTVTAGIVSARGRNINAGPYDDFLQIDAPINRGNSGGPTFNLQGQVVGVNTAIYSPNGGSVGIGFAIPANVVKSVVAALQNGGHVTRGWLGVEIQQITPEMADALGLDKDRGALVAGVQADSPASKAGIKVGDVITAYSGKPVNSLQNLTSAVAATKVGSNATIDVIRGGKEQTLTVTIAQLKDEQQANAGSRTGKRGSSSGQSSGSAQQTALGLRLAPLNQAARQRFDLSSDVSGVVVVGSADNSAAADLGVQPGDVIEQVNNHEVSQPKDVSAQVEQARKAGRKQVALLVNHGGQRQFIAVPLGGNG
jgi:serine protease Do